MLNDNTTISNWNDMKPSVKINYHSSTEITTQKKPNAVSMAFKNVTARLKENSTAIYLFLAHPILRWTLAPFALLAVLIYTIVLAAKTPGNVYLIVIQVAIYVLAILGYILRVRSIWTAFTEAAYNFCMMSYVGFSSFYNFIRKALFATLKKS